MTDLAMLTVAETTAGYAARRFSPAEVARASLDRIARWDGALNAMTSVHEEEALAAAAASETRWRRGSPLSAIDGVTATVKDLVLQAGHPTLRGSRTVDPASSAWDVDAPAVARLREAGAVIVGRTTTPEFGWKGVTDSPLTGITRNPWNPTRTPGGSSGGAAVAAAAGYAALNIGTDGGGSIRIPAGFTGIFGFKPSYGLVPAWPASPFQPVAHLGPMTRGVADAARMLNVLALPDDRDWTARPYAAADFTAGLDHGVAGVRIGFAATLNGAPVHPDIARAVARAAESFAPLGASVEAVALEMPDVHTTFAHHWYVYAATLLAGIPAALHERIDPGLRRIAAIGAAVSSVEHVRAGVARRALGLQMNTFHRTYDLLLTPTLPLPAFAAGELAPPENEGWVDWTPFSYPFNLTEQPAGTVPCGLTAEGLPCGLQIVGRIGEDALVLRAARAYEAAHPWHMPDLDVTVGA